MTDDPHWYVVHSRPKSEADADAQLRRAGFMTFYPFERVKRRRKLPTGKVRLETVELPHFPRYLFVGVREGQSLYHVNNAEAVSTVLYLGPEPLRVPDRVVEALQDACDEYGAVVYQDRTKKAIGFQGEVGDNVEILEGPFASFVGHIAKMTRYDKTGRLEVWLTLFGRKTPVELEIEEVELVSKKRA